MKNLLSVGVIAVAVLMLAGPSAQTQSPSYSGSGQLTFPSGSRIDGGSFAAANPGVLFFIGADPTQSQRIALVQNGDATLTNNEIGTIGWSGNLFGFSTSAAGTGVSRSISIGTMNGGFTVSGTSGDLLTLPGDNVQISAGSAFQGSSTKKAFINTAPTIASGFGTSPSIVASNGTFAFTVNVGTGGIATSGVITLPTAATGWNVSCQNLSTRSATVFDTKQTATTTTSATIGNFNTSGVAAAWVASDVLSCAAVGY